MPVDYSKWDALELSDDSDIEVHPNVDKRSFIRAKQNQIHMERAKRKHEIETLKYERIINDGLMKRINSLLSALRARADQAQSRNPAEVAFQAVMESAANLKPEDDRPPPRPEGVHSNDAELPSYTKMMATLLDQVNKAMEDKKVTQEERYSAMTAEIEEHLAKVRDLQKQLAAKLAELEKEEGRKITSEGLHTGFDSSHVTKSQPSAAGSSSSNTVELLNPSFASAGSTPATGSSSASSDPAKKEYSLDDDEELEPSADAKKFATIKPNDYTASLQFLSAHPALLTERETDALLVQAFDAQLQGRDDQARNCVHQALLLQYCRALGRDGVALFFKRITTPGHQARDVFLSDVKDTYAKISGRVREIKAQRERDAAEGKTEEEGVEQIQLHAVEPGTVIAIRIPPENSEDPAEREGRAIFETFAPDMKAALQTGSLDKVNEVLGKMKVADAEELVGKFSDAGILSMEEEIIDATTSEGKDKLKEIEKKAAESASTSKAEYADDPE